MIVEKIVDQLRAEVPVKTEPKPHIFKTTPSSLSNNLSTANVVQSASDPAIASLVASMMASMEVMCARLDELDTERRDGNGQFDSHQRHRQ